jgi:hypothetical protein
MTTKRTNNLLLKLSTGGNLVLLAVSLATENLKDNDV